MKQEIKNLNKKLKILEILIALSFSICFTLIYAIIKIQGIYFYPSPIIKFGLSIFILSFLTINFLFLTINFILFLINILKRIGLSMKLILIELRKAWSDSNILIKIGAILGFPSFVISIIKIIEWFRIFLEKF